MTFVYANKYTQKQIHIKQPQNTHKRMTTHKIKIY